MQHAAVALSALIHALDSLKMAAIVRYAYDRRSNPQVGAAFPCIKEKYEVCGFISNRKHTINDLSSVCCTPDSLLMSLTLSVCYTWSCRLWRICDSSHSQCWKTTRSSHLQVGPQIKRPKYSSQFLSDVYTASLYCNFDFISMNFAALCYISNFFGPLRVSASLKMSCKS